MSNHITAEAMDEFVMNSLSRFRRERIEEHLRSCPKCVDQFLGNLEFAQAMREAAKLRKIGGGFGGPHNTTCRSR